MMENKTKILILTLFIIFSNYYILIFKKIKNQMGKNKNNRYKIFPNIPDSTQMYVSWKYMY